MPVPRKVSASCGTCVSFTSDASFTPDLKIDFEGYELEGLYVNADAEAGGGYVKV